jgi:hypothetical protein
MAEINCTTTLQNIHQKNCKQLYGSLFGWWIFKSESAGEVTDQDTAETESTWTSLKNAADANRMYVIRELKQVDWDNEEPVFVEGNTKRRQRVRDGHRRVTAEMWNLTRQEVEDYKKLDGNTLYVFDVTEEGHVLGTSSDGTKYTPMKVQFHIDNEMQPNGVDELWKLMIHVDYVEPAKAWSKEFYPAGLSSSAWYAKDLEGIIDVVFTESSAASDSIVIEGNGLYDDREITAEFVPDDFTSTVGAIDSITRSGNSYTLAPSTSFSTGTLALAAVEDQTTQGYETRSSLSITIS